MLNDKYSIHHNIIILGIITIVLTLLIKTTADFNDFKVLIILINGMLVLGTIFDLYETYKTNKHRKDIQRRK